MKASYVADFVSTLFRVPGKGGWVFAPVPEEHAPVATVGWGRTPVEATVEGHTWQTSVWRDRSGRTLLAVPERVRNGKDHGDAVAVRIEYRMEYRA